MAHSGAVRLTLVIAGLSVCCGLTFVFSAPARADSSASLAQLNEQLAGLAGVEDPNSPEGHTGTADRLSAVSTNGGRAPQAARPFKPFPGLVSRFNKAERLLHLRGATANSNFDANLWGAFAGGRGMSVKYKVIVR